MYFTSTFFPFTNFLNFILISVDREKISTTYNFIISNQSKLNSTFGFTFDNLTSDNHFLSFTKEDCKDINEITEKPEPTFIVNGRTLYFKEDIKNYQIIDMSGRIIKTGNEKIASLPQADLYILILDKHKIQISP